MERALARIERDRQEPVTAEDIAALLASYRSPDPEIRAAALRRSCPCHVTWDVYEQLRKEALKLRRDTLQRVRSLANHLEEDARMIRIFEARTEDMRDIEDKRAARQADRVKRPRRERSR